MSVCLSIHVECLSISVPFHLSPVCVSVSVWHYVCHYVLYLVCVSSVYNIPYIRMVMICLIIFEKSLNYIRNTF